MKIKRIIGVGDSFTFGDELYKQDYLIERADRDLPSSDEFNSKYRIQNCFLGQLGRRYQAEVINLGYPGASLNSMREIMTMYLQENPPTPDTLIFAGITQPWRYSWWSHEKEKAFDEDPNWNKHIHSTWMASQYNRDPGFDPKVNSTYYEAHWFDQFKMFLTHQDCDEHSLMNYNQTLLFFDGIGKHYNIPVIQLNVFKPPFTDDQLILVDSFCGSDYAMDHILNEYGKRALMPGWHPNKFGHQLIADFLQKKIDSEILI
jgi:hypothetical protein